MRLRNKILRFMLPLILVPFVLTALAAYYFVIRANRIEANEERNRMVSEAVADLRKEIQTARKDLALLRGVPAVLEFLREPGSEGKRASAETAIKLFFDQNPYYLEITLADSEGGELVRYSRLTDRVAAGSIAREAYFVRTLILGSVQSPVQELPHGKRITVLTDRIFDGEFRGVVVLSLSTDLFERRLRPLLASRELSTFLFDDRGLVFSRSLKGKEEEDCVARLDLSDEASAVLAGPSEATAVRSKGNVCGSFSFAVFPAEAFQRTVYEPQAGENWFLGMLQPEVTDAGTRSFQIFFFIALLLAGAAVLYAATDVSRRITIPLEKFDRATKQIARGDLDIDVEVTTGDEVEDLARTFRAMTADLREYQEKLVRSAKLATIGELASEISHEIQNRISGISLWLQYLDSEIPDDDPRREYLNEMKQGLKGFMEMLANLKQYYKTPVLNVEPVDVAEIVGTAVRFAEAHTEGKEVGFSTETSDDIPPILADRELLKSVLLNVVINAAEAVEPGGEVSVVTERIDGAILISVSDDGCGIPEDDLARIFYPFFTTKTSGSGLGLAIASNVVEAHSGKLHVRSERGAGSVFTIELPVPSEIRTKDSRIDGANTPG